LINRVVSAGQHEDTALELAKRITERPPVAASLAKRVLDLGVDATMDQALATEVEHAILTTTSGENESPRKEFGHG
jgi:enoyl-CoA hydratase/carnithine racemase